VEKTWLFFPSKCCHCNFSKNWQMPRLRNFEQGLLWLLQMEKNTRQPSKEEVADRAYLQHKLCWVCPAMEPEGVKRIFLRSESDRCLQYTGYIVNGDSKSYSHIFKVDPYNGKSIKKYACVGYVHKRLGTALRKLKEPIWKKELVTQ